MRTLLLMLVLPFIWMSCSKDNDGGIRQLTFEDFKQSLKSDMNYQSMVGCFGEPDSDNGYGTHVFVYGFQDSTEIRIGLTDTIRYAHHYDKDSNLFQVLLSDSTVERAYSFFSAHLSIDLDYDEMVAKFGEPDSDIGSGIHIYVYKLIDETEIWVGYSDRIIYVRHLNSEGVLMENMFDPN